MPTALRYAEAEGNVCWNPSHDAATLSLFEQRDTREAMHQGNGATD